MKSSISQIPHMAMNSTLRIPFLLKMKNALVLNSMRKSGTNYLRLLLTNYFFNYPKREKDPATWSIIDYNRMKSELFPNVRDNVFIGKDRYQKPKCSFPGGFVKEGERHFTDFMYDHGSSLDNFPLRSIFRPRNTILLIRNPLDLIVSRYFYFYKNQTGNKIAFGIPIESIKEPRDLIESFIPSYASRYNWMQSRAATDPRSILIKYEELIPDPATSLQKIIQHIGLEVQEELIAFSIEHSSKKKVKQLEKSMGKSIHPTANTTSKTFIRSGKIGEWKEYFTEDDYALVKQILLKHHLKLEDLLPVTYTPAR